MYDFHHLSWTDPGGRLFWRQEHLYRGIRPARAVLYRDLLNGRLIQELVDKRLLIDTWVANWTSSEFPLILQHRVIPTISFPSEWSASHLKAAALLVLDLEIALRPQGLTLVDVNPWNILFDSAEPRYVDFCSIVPLPKVDNWQSRNLFREFYLNPLLLFSKGLSRVARRLLYDPWNGVTPGDLHRMGIGGSYDGLGGRWLQAAARLGKAAVPRSLHSVAKTVTGALTSAIPTTGDGEGLLPQIVSLRHRVAAIPIYGSRTVRAGYYDQNFPQFGSSEKWTAKHRAVLSILEGTKPRTLIDIGANRGWFSQLAARCGVKVIAADSDEIAVNELYSDTRGARLPILSVVMDVRFPEPPQGPGYRFFPSAAQRFESEMALALAIIHHLVFAWHLSFEQILETLNMFTTKWLVIEFVGPTDTDVTRLWKPSDRPWYNFDTFLAAVAKYFDIVGQYPSDSGGLDAANLDTRTIVLCRVRAGIMRD